MHLQECISKLNQNKKSIGDREKYFVYALWDEDKIVYIGQSTRVEARVASHQYTKSFTEYSYFECENEYDMVGTESFLINKLSPKYNKSLGEGYISINKLRQQIRSLGSAYKYNQKYYVPAIRKTLKANNIEIIKSNNIDYISSLQLNEVIKLLVGDIDE